MWKQGITDSKIPASPKKLEKISENPIIMGEKQKNMGMDLENSGTVAYNDRTQFPSCQFFIRRIGIWIFLKKSENA